MRLSGLLLLACVACGGGEVPILMYHSISERGDAFTVSPAQLEAQLQYLQDAGYTTVSLHTATFGDLPSRPIVITFDDGYEDNYSAALPLLKAHKMTATFFVISSFVGRDSQHRVHDPWSQKAHLTHEEIRQLRDQGMEIGSHTVKHSALTSLNDAAMRWELVRSKTELEEVLQGPVEFLAYPATYQNARVRQAAEDVGYKGAVAGTVRKTERYQMRRVFMLKWTTLDDLGAQLSQSWEDQQ